MENYRQLVTKSIASNDLHTLCILHDGLKNRFSAEDAASLRQEIESALPEMAKQKNIVYNKGDNIRVLEKRNQEKRQNESSHFQSKKSFLGASKTTGQRLKKNTTNETNHLQDALPLVQEWQVLIDTNQIHELYELFTVEESLLEDVLPFLVEQEEINKLVILLGMATQNNNFDFAHRLLQVVIVSQKIVLLKQLWKRLPSDFQLRTNDLVIAAESKNTEIMEFLLEQGQLNPLVGSNWSELEPLLDLIFDFSTSCVEKLLFHLRDSEHYEQMYRHIYRELV